MDGKGKKEPYEKPVLLAIELKADEVLALGCKTTTSAPAPLTSRPCGVGRCRLPGS